MAVLVEVEIRQSDRAGYEPMLRAVILQEGRAASGGRAEVFAPGSVEYPSAGIAILVEHGGPPETRGHVIRQRDGRLTLTAPATPEIRAAVKAGKRYMSVEFHALGERTTRAGVREITRAYVPSAALVNNPEYDTTSAEIRAKGAPRLWL